MLPTLIFFFEIPVNPCTQMAIEIEIRNLENYAVLSLDLGFKVNRKLNFCSNISLFFLLSGAKNWIWVSKFHFSFFAEIEITKQDTLKLGFNIVIRNGKIVWKVVWIEYYLRLNLSSQATQHASNLNSECDRKSEWSKQLYSFYLMYIKFISISKKKHLFKILHLTQTYFLKNPLQIFEKHNSTHGQSI